MISVRSSSTRDIRTPPPARNPSKRTSSQSNRAQEGSPSSRRPVAILETVTFFPTVTQMAEDVLVTILITVTVFDVASLKKFQKSWG